MRRILRAMLAFFSIFMMILMLMLVTRNEGMVQAATIRISSQSVILEVGKTKTLSVTGTKKKVTWTSSNKAVATVNTYGKVVARSAGTATIKASVAGKTYNSKITVKNPVRISEPYVTLEKGTTHTLKVTGTSSKINWSSSKSNIASVSSTGKVTAKTEGYTIIYASMTGIQLSSKINVKGAAKKITPTPTATPTPRPTATPVPTATPTPIPSVTATPTPRPTAIPTPISTPTPTSTPSPTPTVSPTPTPVTQYQGRVVGYYAAWARYSGFTPSKIDVTKLTHINYAFANISADLKIELGYPDIDPQNISELKLLKNKNPKLKLLIAIGGWSWSGRFSDAALTEASRTAFADSCVDFLIRYGFDGIDIDWEYPVSGGLSTNIRRPEDKVNFTLLMQKIREKLDAREAVDGKQYVLSFAGAAGSWYLKNIELDKLNLYVDYANVMTYDIHGTWETQTDFNAPLYVDSASEGALYKTSVDTSIRAWINAGMPREKVIMGIPFYGYIYKSVANINNGLYQTYSGANSISFANIDANYLNNPDFKYFFHAESMVPWLFNGTTFITYENEASIAAKADYIKNNNLGGAMIWELSQEPNHVLLDALYQELNY